MEVILRLPRGRWIVRLSAAASLLVAPGAALADPSFEMIRPTPKTYVWGIGPGGDFAQFVNAIPGGMVDVTARLQSVGQFYFPTTGTLSTSGCAASDFAGFSAGSIALIQRGSCSFSLKAQNAFAAGAAGALIFNTGLAGQTEAIEGSQGAEGVPPIPTFMLSYSLGSDLFSSLSNGPVTVRLVTTANFSRAPFIPSAVPEPATWAVMLLGFGFVGAFMRSAKRRQMLSVSYA